MGPDADADADTGLGNEAWTMELGAWGMGHAAGPAPVASLSSVSSHHSTVRRSAAALRIPLSQLPASDVISGGTFNKYLSHSHGM